MLRKSLFYSVANKYISLLIQLVSITVIARVLTPEEIGIYSITASLFGFLLLIRDFGIGSYIIQEKYLTESKMSSAFLMSLVLCWVLSGILYLSKDEVSAFYEIKGMAEIFKVLAINLLIIPFGSINLAMIKRNMRYEKMMVIDLTSNFVSTVSTISFALYGFGFMSLAYGSVLGTVATVASSQFYRQKNWICIPLLADIISVYRFGWKMSGNNIFNQIASSSQDLILGKTQGPIPVSFFNRSQSVLKLFDQLFVKSISSVLQSYLAKESREDNEIKTPILKFESCYLMFAWPFIVFIIFNTKAFILLLFGDQWLGIDLYLDVMSISFALFAIMKFYNPVMISLGYPGNALNETFYIALIKLTIVGLFCFADLIYLIGALVVVPMFRWLIIKDKLTKVTGIDYVDIYKIAKLPMLISLILFVANYSIASFPVFDELSIIHLIYASIINFSIWFLLIMLTDNYLKDEVVRYYGYLLK